MMLHGKDVIKIGNHHYPVRKVLGLSKGAMRVDRIASYARNPSNYGDMKIPSIKVRKSRKIKHAHGPCIKII